MTTVSVHVGTSANFGPITLYSHFDPNNPALNVLDTTSTIVPTLQTNETRVRVGMLPTGDGSPSRTVYVDGLTEMAVGSATVTLTVGGQNVGTFQAKVLANTAPPAADLTGATQSAEYLTPTRP